MARADGLTCWTTTRGEASRGPAGQVVMLRVPIHNIDDRKRAEGQLHLQSAAVNAAAHSMFITDRASIQNVGAFSAAATIRARVWVQTIPLG